MSKRVALPGPARSAKQPPPEASNSGSVLVPDSIPSTGALGGARLSDEEIGVRRRRAAAAAKVEAQATAMSRLTNPHAAASYRGMDALLRRPHMQ